MKKLSIILVILLIPTLCSGVILRGVMGKYSGPVIFPAYAYFTGTDGTTAQTFSGDTNVTWVKMTSAATLADAVINTNAMQATNATYNAFYYNSASTPTSPNYSVQATFTSKENMLTNDEIALLVRVSSSQDTYYGAQYYDSNWYIIKKVNGGTKTTLAGPYTDSWVSGTSRTAKLTVSGTSTTNLELFVGGVSRLTYADSTAPITSTGFAGFHLYGTSSATGCLMDDWSEF